MTFSHVKIHGEAAAYLAFLLLLSLVCFLRPTNSYDKNMYAAAITHNYHVASSSLWQAPYQLDFAANPGHVAQQMPWYAVRPLYLLLGAMFWKLGLSPVASLGVISALSFFAIGLLLWKWTTRPLWAALLMLAPETINLGRTLTPDAVATLGILTGLWLLWKGKDFAGVVCLAVSIWLRSDEIMLFIPAVVWLWKAGRLRASFAAVLCVFGVASVLFIHHFSGNYGWQALMYHNWEDSPVLAPAETARHISAAFYFRHLFQFGRGVWAGSELSIWILAGLVAVRLDPRKAQLLSVVAIALVIRIFVFPLNDGRYFAWSYIAAGAFMLHSVEMRMAEIRAGSSSLGAL